MLLQPSRAVARLALSGLFLCLSAPLSALTDSERIARLEERLAALEARLADQEQETKEVKVMAATSAASTQASSGFTGNPRALDIMANSAWRNLRWTQEEQWAQIRNGMSEEEVIEVLGAPPRSVKSLKPRVDKVLFYETSMRDRSNALRGRVSFKDGKVIAITKPDFAAVQQRLQSR